ncbi:hypothetical protein PSPO01_03139 [Paraphaeosphaeria sporulosa]
MHWYIHVHHAGNKGTQYTHKYTNCLSMLPQRLASKVFVEMFTRNYSDNAMIDAAYNEALRKRTNPGTGRQRTSVKRQKVSEPVNDDNDQDEAESGSQRDEHGGQGGEGEDNVEDQEETAAGRAWKDQAKSEHLEAKALDAKTAETHRERVRKLGPFFALPAEIRNLICEHCLIADRDLAISTDGGGFELNEKTHYLSTWASRPKSGHFNASLARMCKQINVKAGWWLWGKNTHAFIDNSTACSFLVRYASKGQEIRCVRINLEIKYKRREQTGVFGYLAFLKKLERLEIFVDFWSRGRRTGTLLTGDRPLSSDADLDGNWFYHVVHPLLDAVALRNENDHQAVVNVLIFQDYTSHVKRKDKMLQSIAALKDVIITELYIALSDLAGRS